MSAAYIPEGYHTVTTYLVLPRVAEFLEFARIAFGAEITHGPVLAPSGDIMHVAFRIGDSMIMAGSASGEARIHTAMFYIYVPDADAAFAKALAAGATSTRELADQPYGERNGGVVDNWGNEWWVGTPLPQ
ncbi:MAG: VOC family protein [bacterium]